jgi:hypothetical protein
MVTVSSGVVVFTGEVVTVVSAGEEVVVSDGFSGEVSVHPAMKIMLTVKKNAVKQTDFLFITNLLFTDYLVSFNYAVCTDF